MKTYAKILLPWALFVAGCHTPNSSTGLIPPMNMPSGHPNRPEPKQQELSAKDSAKVCYSTAEALEQGGKDSEAVALYDKARQLDPQLNVQATRRLAVLYDRNGEFDKALAEYRRGLQDNPKDAGLLSDLGYGYYCRGEWAEAEKNLTKAVAVNPKLANAWVNLGLTLAQQSRYDESLAAFSKVVSAPQARCNLAFIQVTQGKTEEARSNYELALRTEPGLQIARVALQKINQVNARPNVSSNALPVPGSAHLQNGPNAPFLIDPRDSSIR